MESKNKRSSAMEEIFAAKPDFLLRRANVVFVSVLLLLILASTQITFPEIVNVHVVLDKGEFGMGDGETPRDVEPGQAVVLSVASYPPGQYGYLKGSVFKKQDGSLTIKLSNGVTTSNKEIPLNDGLQADAEIVTRQVSLLERLIGAFKAG